MINHKEHIEHKNHKDGFETRPQLCDLRLLCLKVFSVCANFSGGFCPLFTNASDYSRAKTPRRQVRNHFLPLRLCAFAGDIPAFGCGFAALGSL